MFRLAACLTFIICTSASSEVAPSEERIIIVHNRTESPAKSLTYRANGGRSVTVSLRDIRALPGEEKFRLVLPPTSQNPKYDFSLMTLAGQKFIRRDIDPRRIKHLDFDNRRRSNDHDTSWNWEFLTRSEVSYKFVGPTSIRKPNGTLYTDLPTPKPDGKTLIGELHRKLLELRPRGKVFYWLNEHLKGNLDGADEIWTEVEANCDNGSVNFSKSVLYLAEEEVKLTVDARYFKRFNPRDLEKSLKSACHTVGDPLGDTFWLSSQYEALRNL